MLEFLANIFLQTTASKSDDLAWIAILIAGISAAGVVIGFLLNYKRLGAENDARYIQIMREFLQDLRSEYSKEKDLKTTLEADQYACEVMNVLGRIAHLNLMNKVPYEITDFFNYDFRYGKLLLEWYDEVGIMEDAEKTWFNLAKWCKDNSVISAPEKVLPNILLKILKESRKNKNS